MKNNDDISTIDAAEINQLINRVKQGELIRDCDYFSFRPILSLRSPF
jgi:hypothetical protein